MENLPQELINKIVSYTEPVDIYFYSYTWYESRNKHACYNFTTLNKNVKDSIKFKKIVDRFRPQRNTHKIDLRLTKKAINHNYNFLYHHQK